MGGRARARRPALPSVGRGRRLGRRRLHTHVGALRAQIRLGYFLQYADANDDDSPLYVFDSTFGNDELGKKILEDYEPPPHFAGDLNELAPARHRAPYRWFLYGPKRSGSSVHIDPLATSAWNTLISGCKRWALVRIDGGAGWQRR